MRAVPCLGAEEMLPARRVLWLREPDARCPQGKVLTDGCVVVLAERKARSRQRAQPACAAPGTTVPALAVSVL